MESIKNVAYKEAEELLKQKTGATRVHVISHLVRRCGWDTAKEATKHLDHEDYIPLPRYATNHYVHIDQSTNGATGLLPEELGPEQASRPTKTRWAIMNIWRPIKPITREPLALCDRRTVNPATDLHKVTLRIAQSDLMKHLNQGDGWKTWNATYSPEHKWFYASDMTPEEVLLFKIYDSAKGLEGQARGVPHCVFHMKEESGGERESVEMRCFVFWEDQENE